jgi:hypothetical protein
VEGVLSNPVALGMAHLRLLEAAAGGSALGQALGAGQVNQVDDAVRAHLRWLYVLVSVSLKPAVGKTDAVGLNPTEMITYRSSEPPLLAVGLKSAVGLLLTRKQRVSNTVGYNVGLRTSVSVLWPCRCSVKTQWLRDDRALASVASTDRARAACSSRASACVARNPLRECTSGDHPRPSPQQPPPLPPREREKKL